MFHLHTVFLKTATENPRDCQNVNDSITGPIPLEYSLFYQRRAYGNDANYLVMRRDRCWTQLITLQLIGRKYKWRQRG